MTRDQIATKVRDNLNDNGITYYSVTDINDSIQDAYDEVVVYCECIEKEATLNFVANNTYIDIKSLIGDYYRPIFIYNQGTKLFLDFTHDRNLVSYRADWEYYVGSIRDFAILDSTKLGFSGRLGTITANDKFKLYYKASANTLNGDSHLQISDAYIKLIENYATADLLEQNQEYIKAQTYWAEYDVDLEQYREKIQLLAKSDRMFTRT